VPFAGAVVVPLGLLSGVLSLFRDSLPFASMNQSAADSFIALVDLFTCIPGAWLSLPSPGPLFFGGFLGLVASSGLAIRTRLLARFRPLESTRRVPRSVRIGTVLSFLLLTAAMALPFLRGSKSLVTFLDVGQGDCALVETSGGTRILIDGGGSRENRFDTGRRVVAPFLWDRGIRSLDLVVLSHPHPDHMNGLLSIVKLFPVKALWSSGLDGELEGIAELHRLLNDRAIPFRPVSAGDRAAIGDVIIDVIHPRTEFNPGTAKSYAAENSRSLVLRMTVNGRTVLFPGDIHMEGERAVFESLPELPVDVVKVPHHGSKTSSSEDFITATRPRIAVISVGAGNAYRQPSEDVVGRYERHGVRVYRTDRDGAVMVGITDTGLTVTPWTSLVLERIGLNDVRSWGKLERQNWSRVWIRGREI
jgi:competence protein ComEC